MAVREFDGVDDQIRCAPGAVSDVTFGALTIAFIVKWFSTEQGSPIYAGNTTGGDSIRMDVETFSGTLYFAVEDNHVVMGSAPAENVWHLVAVSKTTGSDVPRFHHYDYSAGVWAHQDGDSTQVDGTNVLDYVDIGPWDGVDFTDGRLAVLGVFPANYTDTAIETAGMEAALQNWVDDGPAALWPFDQDSVSTPLEDITGNGADQTSITGTTVVTGDDPPGFDFSLGKHSTMSVTMPMTTGVGTTSSRHGSTSVTMPTTAGVTETGDKRNATLVNMPVATGLSITSVKRSAATVNMPVTTGLSTRTARRSATSVAMPVATGLTWTGPVELRDISITAAPPETHWASTAPDSEWNAAAPESRWGATGPTSRWAVTEPTRTAP